MFHHLYPRYLVFSHYFDGFVLSFHLHLSQLETSCTNRSVRRTLQEPAWKTHLEPQRTRLEPLTTRLEPRTTRLPIYFRHCSCQISPEFLCRQHQKHSSRLECPSWNLSIISEYEVDKVTKLVHLNKTSCFHFRFSDTVNTGISCI